MKRKIKRDALNFVEDEYKQLRFIKHEFKIVCDRLHKCQYYVT